MSTEAAPWSEGPFLAFDTETTGVNVDTDRLVTVGLVRRAPVAAGEDAAASAGDDAGEVVSVNGKLFRQTVRTWLADPGIPIPEKATAIHGVTTEMARANGTPVGAVASEVAQALAEALAAGTPVIIYNAGYDLALLENELRRHGHPTLCERLGRDIAPIIDPLVIDKGVNRYRKGKRTLDALSTAFGVAADVDLHRADNDAEVTLNLWQRMLGLSPTLRSLSLDQLHQQQITWHRAWAENFNAFLASKGRTADVNENWPF